MISQIQMSAVGGAGETRIMAKEPKECGTCHRMTHFFVNRDGQTRCVLCDGAYAAAQQGDAA